MNNDDMQRQIRPRDGDIGAELLVAGYFALMFGIPACVALIVFLWAILVFFWTLT